MKPRTTTSNIMSLAVVVALLAVSHGAFAESWGGYKKSFRVSFPGYAGSTTLTDFPVLVRLSPELNGFDYSKCRLPNGGDLRFSDSSGNLIPHEIDTWNPSGESLVWVKVPTLTKATTITAYYGNPNPCAASAASVWDSGYVAVWHLGESAIPLAESTGVTTPFATKVGSVVLGAAGIAGGAVDFSSAANGSHLAAKDDDDLDGFDSFTIEVWTKSDMTDMTTRGGIFSKRTNGGANVAYTLRYADGKRGELQIGKSDGSGSQILFGSGPMMPAANVWAHQTYVRDTSASKRYCYLDGVSKETGGTYYGNTLMNSPRDFWLGIINTSAEGQGDKPFNGLIDEVRISRVARSVDWVKATHDTVASDGFTAYNGLVDDWKSYSHYFNVSFTGYAGSSALSGFPVLVRIAPFDAETQKGIRGFSYSDMKMANGGDLRFSDSEGNILAHEIDTWNPAGESLVWVKVPTLTASTKITAYYGSLVPCPPSAESVWDSGYVAVWHLGESAVPLAESTGVTTPFATKVGNVVLGAAGIAGGAVDFSAAETDMRLVAADDPDLNCFDSFTFEFWTKSDTSSTGTKYNATRGILSKRYNGGANVAYTVGFGEWNYGYCRLGSTWDYTKEHPDYNSELELVRTTNMLAAANVWTHSAYVRDTSAGARYGYLNGISKTTGGTYYGHTLPNSTRPLWLGNNPKNGDNSGSGALPFDGLIDEVRISRVARSADWVKATHDTVAADGFSTCSPAHENRNGMIIFVF